MAMTSSQQQAPISAPYSLCSTQGTKAVSWSDSKGGLVQQLAGPSPTKGVGGRDSGKEAAAGEWWTRQGALPEGCGKHLDRGLDNIGLWEGE